MLRPRSWLPTLGWSAATLASIGVATVALQPVLRTAAPGVASPPLQRPPATAAGPASTASASPPAPRRSPSSPAPPRPTVAASTPPVVKVDGWTLTTGADGQPTYTRSFRVCGGQAVIRMVPNKVQLVTATPDPGFTVDAVQNEPNNLAVQFTEPNHYCVIHAVWHNNGPFAEVSEVGS
jgi:hypothetical protein